MAATPIEGGFGQRLWVLAAHRYSTSVNSASTRDVKVGHICGFVSLDPATEAQPDASSTSRLGYGA